MGKHWSTKAGEKNKWILLIRSQVLPGRVVMKRQRVTIILCHSRRYDADNAYAAVKPLVDALKHWNLIVDDSEKWLELWVAQEKCKRKDSRTVIKLEAM